MLTMRPSVECLESARGRCRVVKGVLGREDGGWGMGDGGWGLGGN